MPGLYHTLGVGAQALYTTRQGVDTAGHNIANAQTDGYSRQRVNIKQREPLERNGILIGSGVYVGSISRAHDQFVENQINETNQAAGHSAARFDALKSLEIVFSPELEASVADEVTNFFNSLQELSNMPSDFTVRTNVVESGRNLASAFRRIDTDLKDQQGMLNEKIMHKADEVTDKLASIADLNIRIRALEVGNQGQEANDLRDQRDLLVRDVSKDIEVKYYEDQNGMLMVRGPKQITLVDGGNSTKIEVLRNGDNDGWFDIAVTDWEGKWKRNVTEAIEGGSLQALVELRDKTIPDLLTKNDEMAFSLAGNFNRIHQEGFGLKDYSESVGRNFFTAVNDVKGAASRIDIDDVIAQTTDAISVASSPLAPGDNIIANKLVRLKDEKILGGGNTTLNEFYANYAGNLGLDILRAENINKANDVVLKDLHKRRESVAGVSLDEEATNLLKWQSNFTASSKLITTVDEMLETVLSLKR